MGRLLKRWWWFIMLLEVMMFLYILLFNWVVNLVLPFIPLWGTCMAAFIAGGPVAVSLIMDFDKYVCGTEMRE